MSEFMKLITAFLFLILAGQGFTQELIEKTGSLCSGTLALSVALESGTSVLAWEKDGVVLTGESATSLNCITYGEGLYEVVLSRGGAIERLSLTIGMEEVHANFKATNYPAAAVTFFADESEASESIVGWSWDFGNGETSTAQNPRIMFSEQKDYTITLTVTTITGCSHTITKIHNWSYN